MESPEKLSGWEKMACDLALLLYETKEALGLEGDRGFGKGRNFLLHRQRWGPPWEKSQSQGTTSISRHPHE